MRQQFRHRCIAAGTECYFGDGPIDWNLTHPDRGSFEVHHTQPVALFPQYELETSLWAPSHRICNSLNQAAYNVDGGRALDAGEMNGGYGRPSEDWS
ncbi:MAG: hypothetical protein WBZ37_12060 [Mycobacterium sp.]